MMNIAETLAQVGAPPPAFWENDLEMGLGLLLSEMERDETREKWIARLTGRQTEMVCAGVGLPFNEKLRDRRESLRKLNGQLVPYLLVDRFAHMKSRVAVAEFASKRLPKEVVEGCRINEEDFDTKALLFAIYGNCPTDLRQLFHLEKIQKTGFARMALATPVTKLGKPFADFLAPERIQSLLADFDRERGDHRTSEFREVLTEDGRHFLFIRRADRPSLIVKTVGVEHGFHPEWIILDFSPDANRLRISSSSPSVPLEMANRLAGVYFGKDCEYVNESEETYGEQLRRFLRLLVDSQAEQLALVEITMEHSPLDGSSKIVLSDEVSICKAVAHFTQAVGDVLSAIENLKGIKVSYQDKRVGLIFELAGDDVFVMRYTDQRLSTKERTEFEELMRCDHGIPVLSTEKRARK